MVKTSKEDLGNKLLALKQEIEELRSQRSELDGRRNYLQQQLKKHGLSSEEELKKRIEELDETIEELQAKAEKQVTKIEKDYDVEV